MSMSMFNSLKFFLLAYAVAVQGETFDYVIAGAGTAGLVIANRLSANPDITVAVVEPGDDVRQLPSVQSVDFSFVNFNKSTNWQYPSITSPALGSRNLTYRAGKAWGGTSAVNGRFRSRLTYFVCICDSSTTDDLSQPIGMVYIRGDKAQYDAWERLGNSGWNWDSVFSYSKLGERFIAPTSEQIASGATYDESAHGKTGPLDLGFPLSLSNSTFYDKASATWEALGLETITDLNGGDSHGFVAAPMTLDPEANVREDSARAYYTPVEGRSNLKIIKGTVKRITWSGSSRGKALASGFEYISPSGELAKVRARREIILSASAYRNPLILEASGVGNPK